MIKKIELNNKLFALYVSHAGMEDGTLPITEHEYSLQMLMMKRAAGHVFVKHTHQPIKRETDDLKEVLVVTKGKIEVRLCDVDGSFVANVVLSEGECLYLVAGGFEIEVIEDAEFFEFKNGPFVEDKILL